MSLPLHEDYFDHHTPSEEDIARYRGQVDEAIPLLISRADPANDEKWGFEFVSDADGVHISQAKLPDSDFYVIRGITTAKIDVDWLAARMVTTTTDTFRNAFHMIDPLFLDGLLLHTISCNEEDPKDVSTPFFGVKWACYDAQAPGVVWNRDFCYLEYVVKQANTDGRDMGIGLAISCDYPCESLEESHSLVRGEINGGYLTEYTDVPGEVKLTYMLSADPKGALPPWAVNLVASKQGYNVGRIRDWVVNSCEAGKKLTALPEAEAPLLEQAIPNGENFEVTLGAGMPGTLRFEFCTKEKDIGFRLFLQEKRGLVPVEGEWGQEGRRFEGGGDTPPAVGEVAVQPGEVYVLQWDNTYSYWNAKHLYYRTQMRKELPPAALAAMAAAADDAAAAGGSGAAETKAEQ